MDMWNLADDLGLTVVEHRGSHRSGYLPNENVIHLSSGMRGRTARSVLAHEIAHHLLGHHPTPFGPLRARQERAANERAASLLINLDDYKTAEIIRDGHLPSMAFDLDVSSELVVVYQRLLLRTERDVYVRPRLGVGQWDRRERVA